MHWIKRLDWVFILLSGFLFWQVGFLHSHNHLSPDGATIGLMARHILHGEFFPVFFYGYAYIGSLKAYLAAGLFALFGASEETLLWLPPLFYIGFVWTTYWLGTLLGGRKTARIAMLLTLACSHWLIFFSAEIVGGYMDTLFYGNLLLIFFHKWSEAAPWNQWKWSLALGFVGGLAFWQFPLSGYYLAAVLFCFFIVRPRTFFSRHLIFFLGAFYLGSFPLWWYNWNHHFASFGMVSAAGMSGFFSHLSSFFSHYVPALLSWDAYHDRFTFFIGWNLVQLLGAISLIWLIKETALRWRDPRAPLLFLFLAVVILFCRSDYVGLRSPMVALPLLVIFPLLAGLFLDWLSRHSKILFWGSLLLLVSLYGFETKAAVWARKENSSAFKAGQTVFIDALAKAGVDRVYADYYLSPVISFRTGEKVIAASPYEELVPRYFEKVSTSPSPAFLLTKEKNQGGDLESALKMAGYQFNKEEVNGHLLLHGVSRARNLGREISTEGWSGPATAFDRIVTTRWITPEPQKPGQTFELTLSQETTLTGIELQSLLVKDMPKALKVEVSTDGETWKELARGKIGSFPLYQAGKNPLISRDFGKMEIAFEPVRARHLRLTQEGKKTNHWSIHEIYLYGEEEEKKDPRAEELLAVELRNPREEINYLFPPEKIPSRFLNGEEPAPPQEISRDRWKAEASPAPERAKRAIDRKPKTTWNTVTPQKAGMFWRVDLGQTEWVRRIELHCGNGLWEFPHHFKVKVSDDKSNWKTVTPEQIGYPWWDGKREVTHWIQNRVMRIEIPSTSCRYLMIELDGDEPTQQWVVSDVRIYR